MKLTAAITLGIFSMNSAYGAMKRTEWPAGKRGVVFVCWLTVSMVCANYVAIAISAATE